MSIRYNKTCWQNYVYYYICGCRGVVYDDDDTLATVDCSPRPCNDDIPWMYNTLGMVTLGDTLSGHTFSFGHTPFNQLSYLHHVDFV